jgi:hypothetical protein
MKPVDIRCLLVFILSILSFPSFSGSDSEYGDIIKNTPEYKEITNPKKIDHDNDRHQHYYHYPYHYHDLYYRPAYRPSSAHYRPTGSGRVGLAGSFYLGVTIGESEFDYDDIDDGDASIFRFGYRLKDSRLGYELSFFNSGDSKVTSLTDIEIQVETINLVLTVNSSRNNKSRLNLFGQGGIYFADTTLTGPFDSVSEDSNGFLLAAGIEIMLNRHFSLRAEAYNLFDVEDFANDESISSLNLGGNFIF